MDSERCEICQMRPASIQIKVKKDGKDKLVHLCKDCAEFKGVIRENESENLANFFKKASMNILGSDAEEGQKNFDELECSGCGLTFTEFQKNGLLGCEKCYDIFGEELTGLVRRIHGSHKHIGSRPRPLRVIAKTPDLKALKRELHDAIEQENFEQAADYRDLIRDLEREEHHNS